MRQQRHSLARHGISLCVCCLDLSSPKLLTLTFETFSKWAILRSPRIQAYLHQWGVCYLCWHSKLNPVKHTADTWAAYSLSVLVYMGNNSICTTIVNCTAGNNVLITFLGTIYLISHITSVCSAVTGVTGISHTVTISLSLPCKPAFKYNSWPFQAFFLTCSKRPPSSGHKHFPVWALETAEQAACFCSAKCEEQCLLLVLLCPKCMGTDLESLDRAAGGISP